MLQEDDECVQILPSHSTLQLHTELKYLRRYIEAKVKAVTWLLRSSVWALTFYSLLVTWCINSLIFNNRRLCPHCIYVFCIYLRTNSDLCHLYHKLIAFITEMKTVYCAVRTGSLNKAVCASYLKGSWRKQWLLLVCLRNELLNFVNPPYSLSLSNQFLTKGLSSAITIITQNTNLAKFTQHHFPVLYLQAYSPCKCNR